MKWCITAAILLFMNLNLTGASREAEWKRVQDAMQKNLPRTAITNLEPIITAAMKERAYPEAVKAIGMRIALEGAIEGNKPEEKIPRLEMAISTAPAEIKPVLETLLAHWYWSYFQQNRWRFMQRTATAQVPGTDFTTWDLPRLFSEIDLHFKKALEAEETLKKVPIRNWDGLLQKGTMPDDYRPTLFDFIVYEALEFYTSGEQAATKAQDAFELDAQSPIFDSAEKFLQWNAGPAFQRDFPSPTLNAIALYQKLLKFHQADAEPKLAAAHADLERLTWGLNAAFGAEKAERYKTALKDFLKQHADFDISALAAERLARVLMSEGDLVGARETALRGAEGFAQSPGGKLCRNLVTEIESKSVAISTERIWNAPWPDIKVTYRNIDTVYFRAIPYDWSLFLDRRRNRPEYMNDRERREILQKAPALEWSSQLPPTTDYRQRTAKLAAPSSLKAGFYFVVSSHKPDFSEGENVLSMTDVWVSELALVTRSREGKLEGFVLEASTGEPLPGARVDAWYLNQQLTRVAAPTVQTDTNGFFSFQPQVDRGYLIRAQHEGREVATADEIAAPRQGEMYRPHGQSVLFTDRAIYRPGQTIQYKGIALWVDQGKDNYELLKGEEVNVVFSDVNGKEIARQTRRANDYGSFTGSFTAPRDRLMGQMYLQAQGRAPGQATLRVEEYKRPKFQVTLDAPKTAPKLNEKVVLTGHATSYTGAAVDGAQAQYRVVRQVQMPWWWGPWGRRSWRMPESQEIAHGSVTTGTDGSFVVEFTARPDPQVPEKDEPTFVFQVNADVTDNAGETRTAEKGLRIGYTALEARISAEDWQQEDKPVELTITTRTLDGEPQVTEGSLKVYELEPPATVHRPPINDSYYGRFESFSRIGAGNAHASEDEEADLSSPSAWPLGRMVQETGFTTDTNGQAKVTVTLKRGAYRAMLNTQDRVGKAVTGKLGLMVLKPDASELGIKVPSMLAAPSWDAQPGDEVMALWGTGYETGRAFIEIEYGRQMVQRYWTAAGRTEHQIKLAISEAMRGGVQLHITQVRENRAYLLHRGIGVPWKNKELELKWEHFISKLQPGQKETWTLSVRSLQAGTADRAAKTASELVATLYDESLDAFAGLSWPWRFDIFRRDFSTVSARFANVVKHFNPFLGGWRQRMEQVSITYRDFPPELQQDRYGPRIMRSYAAAGRALTLSAAPMAEAMAAPATSLALGKVAADSAAAAETAYNAAGGTAEPKGPAKSLDQVTARKNLNETAFFFPQLVSDSNGVVRITFTMPEALTKWRFLGFAHDQSLRSGLLEDHAVTAKDLMVQPNPPRFLREGDAVEFVVKVSNQSERSQTGRVRLNFNLAEDEQSADQLLGNARPEQRFEIPAKQSRSFAWLITVPDGCGFLTYKAVGATDSVSDGEEGAVPVLSRRILVTESLPLPIRGPATKTFEFTKLLKSGSSKTLRNESLTVQMVSNPAWYAVLALPYLMEYPHECAEQVFNRLYANALARSIANSDPKVRRIFDQWKNTPALDSPLEKNQELKAVALEETPWLRQAQNESQARRNVGILFDDNRLGYEQENALKKLQEMQLGDGAWPWFPGGRGNDYITLYITSGFGRLRHLGVDVDVSPAVRSLQRLDSWMTEHYERIQKATEPEKYVPSATDALYLYGRSFFLKDMPIQEGNKKAIDFFLAQAGVLWTKTGNRQTEGHLALALKRFSQAAGTQDPAPGEIMKSLKERSVSNEEMGMFWRDTELSWWWYRAPIETQALMIEAFDEVVNDQRAVEDCRVWLLKQKQTQDWKTTKATADAVYALLLRGRNLLSSDALVQVKLGGADVTPAVAGEKKQESRTQQRTTTSQVEPGTGFYEVKFSRGDIKPRMGEIVVKKTDQGVAWGSVNWQYLEDMSKVTPYEGTPLKLQKSLYRKTTTNRGKVLEPVAGPVAVGDELVVRIELRVDRDMEYVHMKDQRGSGTEPVNVLSEYKYQDGLAYYESTRDTASHFFIDYLPKGTYVFEYSTRVQLRGEYQTGVTQIQCMYAPEFNSHSGSVGLVVR